MLENLLRFALKQRYVIIAACVLVIGVGIWAWTALQIVAYPDVADTEVAVITKFSGRPAEEVEQQITIPIERALNAVPRVISRRSRTIFGLSIVKLTFQEGTDDYFARQQVLEKLKEATLPDGIEPELGPLSTPVGEILRYVVETDGRHSAMDIREAHDWLITPKLLQAPGVADVVNFGGLVRQFKIVINPSQLERYKLTIEQISDAVQANNESTGGSVIKSGASQLAIRSVGRITKPQDIENIVVATQSGTPIFVRDLASVEIGALTPSGVLGFTDKLRNVDVDNSVEGIVLMRRGENPSEVLQEVKARIAELNEGGKLPDGMSIRIMYDRTDLVSSTLETVAKTLFEGVSIVMIVLVFFLGNIRAAISVALTIPLSLLFAFIAMKFTGIPANLLSLGAIDFGIIVDSAVVMVESIMRHLSHAKETAHTPNTKKTSAVRTIFTAASEVQRQIVFAVVIIILAYLPLFTLQRVEGKLFSPMAYTLSYAIGGSLVLALTIVPVMCSFLLAKNFSEWHNPIVHWLETMYRRAVAASLRRPLPTIAAGVLIVMGAIGVGSTIGTEFLPELDEGGFNIRCILPAGISLDAAREYPKQIRAEIAGFDEVKFCISQLGRNDDGTDPFGPNRIETLVQLQPYNSWTSGRIKKDLLKQIKSRLEQKFPGAAFSFSQPILDNVTEAVTGSAADLAVLVNGDDVTELRRVGNEVLRLIKPIRGASESGIEQEGPQTQLVVEINREAAARFGITIRDVDNMIELAIAGKPISQVYEKERRFDITLRYTQGERATPEAIANLLILTPSGMKIPLSQVATVRLLEGQTIIAREDGRRQVSVRTNIRERDQGSYVAEAQTAVKGAIQQGSLKIPEKYDIKWGGQFENLTRARVRLSYIIPITLLLIFLVLFVLFDNSAKYAGIVMMNVPFALVGGVAALWLRGINFSVSAGVGFVSLFGVAVMSGVLLISYINLLRQEQLTRLQVAVVQGAVTQFRPVMMMMMVALIGLIPAARATGIGSDVQRPLATVIVGGLVSALVLTLLVMPALYYVIEKRAARKTLLRRKHGLDAKLRAREDEDL
jgi:cobalt-zinc-cadmium resistance protein CzcA